MSACDSGSLNRQSVFLTKKRSTVVRSRRMLYYGTCLTRRQRVGRKAAYHPKNPKTSLALGFVILLSACVTAWALWISYSSHANEARLKRILDALAVKFPDLDLELRTISSHQEIVVAPVYYLARFTAMIIGPISSGVIVLLDRILKMLTSIAVIAGISYLVLHNAGTPRKGMDSKFDVLEGINVGS